MPSNDTKEKITEILEVSFAVHQFKQTLKSYKYVLDAYKIGQPKALKLEGDTPIFLDTNVLLSVYEVSLQARDKIKQFVQKYKDRIIITGQVQREYIKNREKVINNFQTMVTEQIPRNFKNDVVNKFTSFKNVNKSKLEDYADIQSQLDVLETDISSLFSKISEEVDDKRNLAQTLLLEDDFLDTLSQLSVTEDFSEKQLKQICDDYDKLLSKFKETQGSKTQDEDKELTKEPYSLAVFPGCGEKASKEEPQGDFIVFHELMQFARNNKTDVIFLTNDTTKGDWLRKDGKTHIHYLENFYHNTGQLIYIINAERLFAKLFEDVSFQSLVPSESLNNEFNIDTLYDFLSAYKPLDKFSYPSEKRNSVTEELQLNGIVDISQLKTALDKTANILDIMFNRYPKLNKVGAMRGCLIVLNEDYITLDPAGAAMPKSKRYDDIRDTWQLMNDI